MVKPDIFTIVFDNPNRVYQPGQCVAGHIDLQVSKEMKTDGVYLTVYGGATARWTERESRTRHNASRNTTETYHVTVSYHSSEVYINTTLLLWGNGNTQVVPPGRYIMPFSVPLPQACLPSFQGSKGRIQYYCAAKIDRPWRFDHRVKEMFTVLPVYDLNRNPTAAIGVSAEEAKSIGCCCWAAGTVYFKLKIPKGGFVPGECIKATVHIDNQSTRQMERVEISLMQVICYAAARDGIGQRRFTKTDIRNVSAVAENLEGRQAPSKYSLTKDIPIPPVVPTMGNNSIIQVYYKLDCELVPTGLSTNSTVNASIIIGTIPLLLPPTAQPLSNGNDSTSNPSLPISSLPSVPEEPPPPSYEECMFGKMDARGEDDNEYTGGDLTYAPKYPVYQF